jgi:response regulator RpfG family c-di-GMP phosphodiesterase
VPVADALEELRRCAGTQFDPAVVEAFCHVLAHDLEDADRAA